MNSRRLTDCLSSRGSYPTMQRATSCIAANSDRRCPLWVKSGHCAVSGRCPLYPQKRTSKLTGVTFGVVAPATSQQWLRSAAPTPAWRYLPHRKHSTDIVGRCAEYTEGDAAAYKAEQHGRFHAIDLLPVDVGLVGEVG